MHPRLLHLWGPLWIQSYGVMIAIGFLVFIFLTMRHPLRIKTISKELYLNTLFIGLAGGIIGGRLLHVIMSPSDFTSWKDIFYPWVPGFIVLGSIIGAIISVTWYLRKHKVPILPVLDLAALYGPLFQSISRLGCLLAGCCYGAPTTIAWAITFTNPQASAPLNIPLHPTQLYTSIVSFIIFIIVQTLASTFIKKPGLILCSFLMLENMARFVLDFWRGDRQPIIASLFDGALSISQVQLLSCAGFVLAAGGFVWLWYRSVKN